MVVALAITGALVFLWWGQKRLRQHVRSLENEHLLDGERQRIATDLHDDLSADVSNLLLLSRIGLKKLDSANDPREELQRIEGLTGGMLRKIDEIIWSLDPKSDRWDASIAFIDRYAADMAQQHGIQFRTDTKGVTTPITLGTAKRRDLYLAAKEVLQNVVEHAGATNVALVAHTVHNALVLRITDDGTGPSLNTSGGGQGLKNIRRRIERWDGSVRINTLEPKGTSVVIALPLDVQSS